MHKRTAIVALCLHLALLITACENRDEPKIPDNWAELLEGEYTGTCSVEGSSLGEPFSHTFEATPKTVYLVHPDSTTLMINGTKYHHLSGMIYKDPIYYGLEPGGSNNLKFNSSGTQIFTKSGNSSPGGWQNQQCVWSK